ncbi:protein big brother-like [Varroa jacobsoni]|uniref:Protein big brother n=1 Tax=Varroa destructor TaxID=109461 RepID=A0A7M7K4N0_VARDE|nr:protein big brother-like [Varroa destructor]XP_022708722.1 protein big brother-like [Varroa jacobsoni]
MLPFETPSVFDQLPRYLLKIPRVVKDQKHKFDTDDLFRKLSREGEVRYTGFRDRPREERQIRFQNGVREGHTDLAFVASGTNLQLVFSPCPPVLGYSQDYCDFTKERGKVHLRSAFIMNGVCVRWRGWVDLERLDGAGCLEFDEDRARIEDAILREQIEVYNQRVRQLEEIHKVHAANTTSATVKREEEVRRREFEKEQRDNNNDEMILP